MRGSAQAGPRGVFPIIGKTAGKFSNHWKSLALAVLGLAAPAGWGASALIEEAELVIHPRVFYMYRDYERDGIQEALAAGGWLGLKSGVWRGLSLGGAVYTCQNVYGPESRHGTGLFPADEQGFTILGEAYVQGAWQGTTLTAYRQRLETPFLNARDVRLTPATFEAYALASRAITNLLLMVAHVPQIKLRNGDRFISMTEAAGIKGTNEAVSFAGAVFTGGPVVLQAWNYYGYEFMNTFYAQADLKLKPAAEWALISSAQLADQRSVGAELGGAFQTGMAGVQQQAHYRGWKLVLGYTQHREDHAVLTPWGSYPGFTSIMEEDCNVAGTRAWIAGVSYDFEDLGLRGFSVKALHTWAWTPALGSFSDPAQLEYDINFDYRFPGVLKGLWVRLRTALTRNSLSKGGQDIEDYRFIINYELPLPLKKPAMAAAP